MRAMFVVCFLAAPAVAAPAVTAKGTFGTATASRAGKCTAESCPVAVSIKGGASAHPALSCDEGVELSPIRIVTGRDDLLLVCRTTAGAGWTETRSLLEVAPDAIRLVYTLATGSYLALSPAEKKAGALPSCPVGSITVEKVDAARPLLRIVDPALGELKDGKGVLPGKQLAFDPGKHALVPTGAPDTDVAVDAHVGCKPR